MVHQMNLAHWPCLQGLFCKGFQKIKGRMEKYTEGHPKSHAFLHLRIHNSVTQRQNIWMSKSEHWKSEVTGRFHRGNGKTQRTPHRSLFFCYCAVAGNKPHCMHLRVRNVQQLDDVKSMDFGHFSLNATRVV